MIRFIIVDYAQMLNAKPPDSSINRYEYAAEKVKEFAIQHNVHIFMTSQVNQSASRNARAGKAIGLMDANWLRPDKFNLYLTLDRLYVGDDENAKETPCFWLTVRKASYFEWSPDDNYYDDMRVPIIMKPTRFYFDTLDKNNWTKDRKYSYVKGNKFHTGQEPYIGVNESKWNEIPSI